MCLNTDAVELSPIDIARILDAIFGNASGNADVSAQYQGDAVQYRPVNISVSIRISSPGNDGPVEQTNLVRVQASVSVEVAQAVQPLAGPLEPTIGVATTVDIASADGGVAQQEPVAGDGESMSSAPAEADIETPTTEIFGPTPLDSPFSLSSGPVSPRGVAISRLAWGIGRPPSLGWITPISDPRTAGTDDTARGAAPRPHNTDRPAPPPHRLPLCARGLPWSSRSPRRRRPPAVVATAVGSRSRCRFRSCSPSSIPVLDGYAHRPACRLLTSPGGPSGPGERLIVIPSRGARSGVLRTAKGRTR